MSAEIIKPYPFYYGQKIFMYRHARILGVREVNFRPVIWAIVDPRQPEVERRILAAVTEDPWSGTAPVPERGVYIGTVVTEAWMSRSAITVQHFFDLGEIIQVQKPE